jgi:putative protein-disulfide isomerase
MNNNKLVCDLETGICGEVGEETTTGGFELIDLNKPQKKIDLYYVTDPICSHCWALEPVLQKFTEEYSQYLNIHTVVGGMLKSWDGFADVSNGIGGPADVASHWREVGDHSRMPIDGSLWLDNPIQSSYPPSRIFAVLQQKDAKLASTFLRNAREAVFAFNRNIGEADVLKDIVNHMGLDGEEILKEAESASGEQLLSENFALASSLGVRGFPTIIMMNEEKKGVKVVGARPSHFYEDALKQVLEMDNLTPSSPPALSELLRNNGILFSKEIEVMYGIDQVEVQTYIEKQLPSGSYMKKEILGEIYLEQV